MFKKSLALILSAMVGLSLVSTSAFAASATEHKKEKSSYTTKKADDSAPVNLNTADAKTLMTLKFVGKKRAADIIAYRDKNGAFHSVDDLKKVKGVTEKIIEANKDRLRFS